MVQLKPLNSNSLICLFRFQFHNGTIKTTLSYTRLHQCCNFNSIMVQLKLEDLYADGAYQRYFNSIMVQLKHDYSFILPAILPKFQFHNGTIKTRNTTSMLKMCLNFNSIMVQLKPIDIYNGNLVFTEVSLRINVYFFAVKMSMYNESIFADLRQHLHLIFIVKG